MSIASERTAGAAIGLRRLFTSPGVHPYDEIVWERRDARIAHWQTGAIAFEQRDVEFPASWSQNATNIVAQKYFRGTVGAPGRETSGSMNPSFTPWGEATSHHSSTPSRGPGAEATTANRRSSHVIPLHPHRRHRPRLVGRPPTGFDTRPCPPRAGR